MGVLSSLAFAMKKVLLALSLVIGLIFIVHVTFSHADQQSDCQQVAQQCTSYTDECNAKLSACSQALNQALQMSKNATTPLESQLTSMQQQLAQIQAAVANIEADLALKKKQIADGYKDLAAKELILNAKIRDLYIKSYYNSPISFFLSAKSATNLTEILAYQKAVADQDKMIITNIALTVQDLENRKQQLETQETNLTAMKANLDAESAKLDKIVADAKAYQATLSNQIAELSSVQQNLLAQKAGNFSVSVGSAALADDYNGSLSGWQSNAPSGSLTVFSFGAYANNGSNYQRNGMSQYGAWARAKNGEDYQHILQDYYGSQASQQSMPGSINTDQGSMPFETQYLYGIAEMPSSWTDNNGAALEAQAVAARTYAYHYIKSGSTICTNDNCQVYSASKASNPPQAWKDAVDNTKGMVLPDSVHAQYVSTPGGYIDTKGWDTNCGNQGCLASGAWDAASPWFYKAWYTNYTYGSGFSSCDRNNPWLSQSDMADILNAWVVYTKGSSDDKQHILPPDGCGGGSPYSTDQMKSKADSLGGSYSSASLVSVQQSSGGYTSTVIFQTNNGQVQLPGFNTSCSHPGGGCQDFWTIFNLRAPGDISIKSRLFDIRQK